MVPNVESVTVELLQQTICIRKIFISSYCPVKCLLQITIYSIRVLAIPSNRARTAVLRLLWFPPPLHHTKYLAFSSSSEGSLFWSCAGEPGILFDISCYKVSLLTKVRFMPGFTLVTPEEKISSVCSFSVAIYRHTMMLYSTVLNIVCVKSRKIMLKQFMND